MTSLPYDVIGLLGVLFVDLFQAWPVVPKPWLEFGKLFFIAAVGLGLGTLPFMDNWGHLGGLIIGIKSGIRSGVRWGIRVGH